jgi:hypothetical protein
MTAMVPDGERIVALEGRMTGVEDDVRAIKHDVREMRDQLAGRPSWAVVTYITLMTSATVGLLVALASKIATGG